MKRLKRCIALSLVIMLMVNFASALAVDVSIFGEATVSLESDARRENYYTLLDGKYFAAEFIDEFENLFGNQYTAEEIERNYTEIFDIEQEEMDEAVLGLLVRHYKEVEQCESLNAVQSRREAGGSNGEYVIQEYAYPVYSEIESP